MIQLAVGDFYRMTTRRCATGACGRCDAARELAEPPLTAASTAVLAARRGVPGRRPRGASATAPTAAALVDAHARRRARPAPRRARQPRDRRAVPAPLRRRRRARAARAGDRPRHRARARSPRSSSRCSATSCTSTGRVAESAALLDGAVEAARLSGNAQALGWNLLSRAFTALAAGDLPTALGAAQESVEVTRDLDDTLSPPTRASRSPARCARTARRGRAIEVLAGRRRRRGAAAHRRRAGGPTTSSC